MHGSTQHGNYIKWMMIGGTNSLENFQMIVVLVVSGEWRAAASTLAGAGQR